MSAISVDAGTSLVKAVRFDEQGVPAAVARQRVEVLIGADGASEQDMEAVWTAVADTVAEVAAGSPDEIAFLAVTGQGDGCWLVDADGRPTGPAALWNDARAADLVERWDADGVLEQAFRVTGALGFPGTSAAILTWLGEHQPGRVAASAYALTCDGWLFGRLTGRLVTDGSDAAVPFVDARTGDYATSLLDLFGIPWAARLLPPILADDARAAALLPDVADRIRLPRGLPVVLAPFDIPATAIGVGATRPGQAFTILGTTLCTGITSSAPSLDGPPVGMTIPAGTGQAWVQAVAAMAGTGVLDWATLMLGLDRPADLADLAGTAPPGAGGLFLHPYLSPAGERAPIRTSHARGSFVGMSFEHDRAHVARAVLEGLSFVVRDCLAVSEESVTELRLCGGGANSAFWCQLLADVTGAPTVRSGEPETGAKGAYLVGLAATGRAPSIIEAADSVRVAERCTPDPSAVTAYDELFAEFLALRTSLAGDWPRLARVRDASSRRLATT